MQLKTKRRKVENWLKSRSEFINITGIEKSLNSPKGLVQKFIKYDRKIHDKYIESLYDRIKMITTY